jgi:hypothetical protein
MKPRLILFTILFFLSVFTLHGEDPVTTLEEDTTPWLRRVVGEKGGRFSFKDLEVKIEENTFGKKEELRLRRSDGLPAPEKGHKVLGKAVHLNRVKRETNPLTRSVTETVIEENFSAPVTISFRYDEEELEDRDNPELTLFVGYFNEETGEFERLDSYVDVESRTVTARLSHFSLYQLMEESYSAPRIEEYQESVVSPFAGEQESHREMVSTSSGGLLVSTRDIDLKGPGDLRISLERTYSSLRAESYYTGDIEKPLFYGIRKGWQVNIPYISLTENGNATLVMEGSSYYLGKETNKIFYQSSKFQYERLASSFAVTYKTGLSYHFNLNGLLTKISDPNSQNQIHYFYTEETGGRAKLYSIGTVKNSPEEGKVFFLYNDTHQLESIEIKQPGEESLFVHYGYDEDNRLTRVTGIDGRVTAYEYKDERVISGYLKRTESH